MPTNPQDPQQVHKKRHVGNDQVHIIFSEHTREYNPSTIKSQFNDAHIVIHPISHGRYRVRIHSKREAFGPLCDGMIIDRSMGALLSRRTAVCADRLIRQAQYGSSSPVAVRLNTLKEFLAKYPCVELSQKLFTGKMCESADIN
eukprot:c1798_g1_i1.p1 GENE.c1798_g1_i1~~c1798_g1_i1.p1  ORF type:complete len:144 (+),score=36.19 c1798_g1_i1:147-578(+)